MKSKLAIFILIIFTLSCTSEQRGNLANIFMNKNSFEDLVERFEGEDRLEWQKPEKVIDLFGNVKGDIIIDIGAGTGYFAFRMAKRGAHVIAADVDDRFLEYIDNKIKETNSSRIKTKKVEYDDPLLKENEVDKAIIVNTYHHIDNRVKYFSKVARGIKPNGSLMVVDFKKQKTAHGPPKRYKVSAKEVVEELKKSGFKTFDVNMDLLENQYVVIAHKD